MVLAALGENDAEVWVFGSCARMARCGGTATSISRPGRAAPCHSAFWPRLRRRSGGARTLQCQCNTPIRRSSPKSSAKASSGGISAAACRAEGAHHPWTRSSTGRIERGGAISRLIDTFEAIWKACRHLLAERENPEVAPPNSTILAARRQRPAARFAFRPNRSGLKHYPIRLHQPVRPPHPSLSPQSGRGLRKVSEATPSLT